MRVTRSTDDFLAASRTVRSRANAAAIAGQSLSVASFLGVAGIVLSHGVDGLWYPVGFVAGFLEDGVGEEFVDLTIDGPVLRIEFRPREDLVTEWPESGIGHAVVIAVLLLLA